MLEDDCEEVGLTREGNGENIRRYAGHTSKEAFSSRVSLIRCRIS